MGARRRGRNRFLLVILGCTVAAAAAAMLLASMPAAAEPTLVPAGNLSANQAWSAGGSPYNLLGPVIVPYGFTLSIGPGVVLDYSTYGQIVVEGTLEVSGSTPQSIVIGPGGRAPCVEVNSTGVARIHYAYFDWCADGVVVHDGGAANISDTVFNSSSGTPITIYGNTSGVELSQIQMYTDHGQNGIVVTGGRARLVASGISVTGADHALTITNASDVTVRDSTFHVEKEAVEVGDSSSVAISSTTVGSHLSLEYSVYRVDRLNLSGGLIGGGGLKDDVLETAILSSLSNSTLSGIRLYCARRAQDEGGPPPPPTWGFEVRSPTGPNTFSNNAIDTCDYQLFIDGATDTQTVAGNSFQGSIESALWLRDTVGANVTGNRWTNDRFPLEVSTTGPDLPQYYRHNVTTTNLIEGRPILYLVDASGLTLDLDPDVGPTVVALVGAHNVSLSGGSLDFGLPSLLIVDSADVDVADTAVVSWWRAVEVVRSQRVRLDNVSAHGNLTCIGFRNGSSNTVVNSSATECWNGLLVEGSEHDFAAEGLVAVTNASVVFFGGRNLTLSNSLVQDCARLGVSDARYEIPRSWLRAPTQVLPEYGNTEDLRLLNVSVGNCPRGISLASVAGVLSFREVQVVQATTGAEVFDVERFEVNGSSFSARSQGIHAERVAGGTVETSTFAGTRGTGLSCTDCHNITVRENIFVSNGQGVGFLGGSGCLFTRNEFYWNAAPASTDTTAHAWDDGAVGNLWDTYTGLDADGDGIGDTPFVVSTGTWGTALDHYPIAFRPDDVPPVADAGPDLTVDEDVRVYFTGYLSTDDFRVRVHLWTFVDGNETVTLAGVTTWYVFKDPGRYTVTLTVIDWGGNRDTDTLIVTVRDRTGPAVDAGPDRTVDEDVPVLLDGTGTFDNDPGFPAGAVFRWRIYDRQAMFTLLVPRANWTFETPGRYRVTLEVWDASGNAGFDEAWITVLDTTPPDVPPLTPPPAQEDFPFSAYASLVTDNDPNWPDGRQEWFELWSDGSFVNRSDASPGRFLVDTPGQYTVYYFVSDAAGNVGQANVSFRVKDVTPPDLSRYGSRSEAAGATVAFNLSLALDNDPAFPRGATASWLIRLPAGAVALSGQSADYRFVLIGDFLVTLDVWDLDGNWAQTQFPIHIGDTEGPVIVIEGATTAEAGVAASFHANVSDPSGVASVVWRVPGRPSPVPGEDLNYVFLAPGRMDLMVTAVDTYGNAAQATWTVVVEDTRPPTAWIATAPSAKDGRVTIRVNQTFSALFVGGDWVGVSQVLWSWGDGGSDEGGSAAHAWGSAGQYTVTVTATDGQGNVNSTSLQVVVEEPVGDGQGPSSSREGSSEPTVPTGEVLSPASLAMALVGAGLGVLVGLYLARQVRPPRRAR